MARRYAVTIIVVVASLFVVAVVVNIGYTRYVAERADRRQAEARHAQDLRWCDLFKAIDPADKPPTTSRGEATQKLIRDLSTEFGCEGKR